MSNLLNSIESVDPSLAEIIQREKIRQEEHIELIASENYASLAVLAAQGSVLTNKYAEGYPGKRYYGGCTYVDEVETLAIERANQLFSADYANVQPHSGSQANAAVYFSLLQPGDTILGMALPDGGHLTHGSPVNFSGKYFNAVSYGVSAETGLIDYQMLLDKALAHRPKLIIAGFSAYSRILDWAFFREVADKVGAYLMADIAHIAGLVATGLYPSPFPYAHIVTTTTHKTLRGPRGGMILTQDQPELAKKINSMVFPGTQGGPLMHVIAAKAVAFQEALQPSFKAYQEQVLKNAKVMAQVLIKQGYPIVSGGTENHLFLLDFTQKNLTGKEADQVLSQVNITVNKNSVPNDTRSPFITSGIRIGTPAVTTRGFTEQECLSLAQMIVRVLDEPTNYETMASVKEEVSTLCKRFPVYAQDKL